METCLTFVTTIITTRDSCMLSHFSMKFLQVSSCAGETHWWLSCIACSSQVALRLSVRSCF